MPIGAGHMKRVKDVEARAYSTPGACGYCRDNKDTVNADGSVTQYWAHESRVLPLDLRKHDPLT